MTDTIATDNPFTPEERTILQTLAGMIIPPSSAYQVPGADDELIFADILNTARASENEVRKALAFAQSIDKPLQRATAELQGNPQLTPIVAIVMQCYYRDDRVMESLNMEARPPFPKGYEVPQGDWSILEPVQQRGKIWRDA